MPQLRRFTVENFKCFREPTTFEFSDVNLLYGKNSAGKSSLFDAIEYFRLVFNHGGYDAGGWDFVQKNVDFTRIVSGHDVKKAITFCADFEFQANAELIHEVIDFKGDTRLNGTRMIDGMRLIGDLPISFLSTSRLLAEYSRHLDSGNSFPGYPSHVFELFPSCPPLILRENIRTVGVEMKVEWLEHERRPSMTKCKIRVNDVGMVMSSEVAPDRFDWGDGGQVSSVSRKATATRLNGEHPCLPYSLVDLNRCGKILGMFTWRGERFEQRLKEEEELHKLVSENPDEDVEFLFQREPPNELTIPDRPNWTISPFFRFSDDELEYAKLKCITAELSGLTDAEEQLRIGKDRWRRPLPSELQSDDDVRAALEHERQLLSRSAGTSPWIESALTYMPRGLVAARDSGAMINFGSFSLDHLCDNRYWTLDPDGDQYWDDEDNVHRATGKGSPGCSEDEKNWNALVYHCWILGHFAIENVREGLRGLGRVPPIRERVSNVSDLGPETTKSINQWLSHDDGFQLGVRIRSTHEVVRDELRNAVESLSGEDAELLTHKLIDLTHRFGRFEDSMLVNQDSLPVRAEEIGTGVSQLIPVVIQAFRGGIQMFEQPELHLHAEPQLVLGDMFLDAKCQAFLETHSLPLLLRIMRRIREQSKRLAEGTGEGEEKADRSEEVTEGDPERLLADAIRVWHIRDHEGSSRAEEIRIDNKGMLIDEWPDDLFDVKFREVFGR